MTEVLKALQELRVGWKKIGHYNMKCRWVPGHHDEMINNAGHSNHYFGDNSSIIETDGSVKQPNVVKFEVQVMFLLRCFCSCNFYISSYGLITIFDLDNFVVLGASGNKTWIMETTIVLIYSI